MGITAPCRDRYDAHLEREMRIRHEDLERLAREAALLTVVADVVDPVAEIPDEDVLPLVTQLIDSVVTAPGAPARPLVGLVAA